VSKVLYMNTVEQLLHIQDKEYIFSGLTMHLTCLKCLYMAPSTARVICRIFVM
jgi:hypothetical protein